MDYFYCPDCGQDVKAPHFCQKRGGGEGSGIGFRINLTKFFARCPDCSKFGVPTEYTDALQKAHEDLAAGRIDQEEFDDMEAHIHHLIRIWARLNGKEEYLND